MPRLDDLLIGFGSGALDAYTTRKVEERKMAMELAQAKALLQEKEHLTNLYDPERLVANRILNLARVAGQVPRPEGGYNIAERSAGIPEQVAGAAQERELNVLRHLLPRSASAISLSPIVFDPNSGQYFDTSGTPVTSVPRGTPVRSLPLSEGTITRRAEAQARGTAAGQRETPERVQAASAVDSMLASLDDMEQFLTEDPSRLLKSKIPFVEREFAAILSQFDKEAAIAAGGKQLTQTELKLIRQTRPTVQDMFSPDAIRRKIAKLRAIGKNAQQRLARVPETGKPQASFVGRFQVEAE